MRLAPLKRGRPRAEGMLAFVIKYAAFGRLGPQSETQKARIVGLGAFKLAEAAWGFAFRRRSA